VLTLLAKAFTEGHEPDAVLAAIGKGDDEGNDRPPFAEDAEDADEAATTLANEGRAGLTLAGKGRCGIWPPATDGLVPVRALNAKIDEDDDFGLARDADKVLLEDDDEVCLDTMAELEERNAVLDEAEVDVCVMGCGCCCVKVAEDMPGVFVATVIAAVVFADMPDSCCCCCCCCCCKMRTSS